MAKAADSTITPDTDCNALMTAALQAADQAAREPDRLRQTRARTAGGAPLA